MQTHALFGTCSEYQSFQYRSSHCDTDDLAHRMKAVPVLAILASNHRHRPDTSSLTRSNGIAVHSRCDGTSFATPHVAGTAALWLLHLGDEVVAKYPEKWKRVEAFKRILVTTAQPGVEWNRNLYGAGILDAAEVLRAELPDIDDSSKDDPA